jgi:zinc transporter ZupT
MEEAVYSIDFFLLNFVLGFCAGVIVCMIVQRVVEEKKKKDEGPESTKKEAEKFLSY